MELTIAAAVLGVLCTAFAAALASRGLLSAEESLWASTLHFIAAGVILVLTSLAVPYLLAVGSINAVLSTQ